MRTRNLMIVGLVAAALGLMVTRYVWAQGATVEEGEFDSVFTNPCNGEEVALHNEFRVVTNSTEDGSGGFHTTMHLTNQASGEGLTTGTKYHDVVQSNSSFNTPDPDNFERTITVQHLLISQGDAPNWKVRLIFHITVVDGDLKASVINTEAECAG